MTNMRRRRSRRREEKKERKKWGKGEVLKAHTSSL